MSLMSHCYSRDCLRGSSAADKTTALHDPSTFQAAGCECPCLVCRGVPVEDNAQGVAHQGSAVSFTNPRTQKDDIVFRVANGTREMLRLSSEGFFVEGRQVTDDDAVYRTFKAWLEEGRRASALKV